jgi:hypothetical protein
MSEKLFGAETIILSTYSFFKVFRNVCVSSSSSSRGETRAAAPFHL